MPYQRERKSHKLESLPPSLRSIADELIQEKFGVPGYERFWGIDFGYIDRTTTLALGPNIRTLGDAYLIKLISSSWNPVVTGAISA